MDINSSFSNFDYKWTRELTHYSLRFHLLTLGVPLVLTALIETIVEVAKASLSRLGWVKQNSKIEEKKPKSSTENVYTRIAITVGVVLGAYLIYQACFSGGSLSEEYFSLEQCPSIERILEDQKASRKWDWSIETLRSYFGSERDLSIIECRFGLYDYLKRHFELIAQHHPSYQGEYTEEIARDVSSLRDTVRTYVRERGSEWTHSFLDLFEPREKGFEFYWDKYHNDPNKIIEGTMKSNWYYDKFLRFVGSFSN